MKTNREPRGDRPRSILVLIGRSAVRCRDRPGRRGFTLIELGLALSNYTSTFGFFLSELAATGIAGPIRPAMPRTVTAVFPRTPSCCLFWNSRHCLHSLTSRSVRFTPI